MEKPSIISIGDNVCDKYLSRNKMYPGGQCVNTCVYSQLNGVKSAYLGKFGSDEVAECVKSTLDECKIDYSHSRTYKGENGFALVTLKGNDRVFLGSNKGGIAKEHSFSFTGDDLKYIKGFNLIYTNLNSYIEGELKTLYDTNVPIAFDFSTRWNDEYLKKVGPYVTMAIMSCAHLDDVTREQEMKKAAAAGIKIVLGTVGEDGSYVLFENEFYYASAKKADNVIDTMGAGDSYFSAFMCSLLKAANDRKNLIVQNHDEMKERLLLAMQKGASFAAEVCSMEGAFGHGADIKGRTTI